MANSQPWITLSISYERSLALLTNASRERYLAEVSGHRAGFLMVSMQGAFVGYVQLLGVAAEFRGQGVGKALIEFAEQRIFRETQNVFICVSDFNQDAQRFYARMGYERVGELRDFIVAGHFIGFVIGRNGDLYNLPEVIITHLAWQNINDV